MDVLLIGGTGLISTGITRELARSDHEVTLYNRGRREVDIPADVSQIHGDRFEYDAFRSQVSEYDFDCVIDMICFSPEDAHSLVETFGGQVEQLIMCSTVDVYSRPVETSPVTEDHARSPPTTDYGRDKAACEDILMDAHRNGAFETTVLRPWHTYGEGGVINHTLGRGTYYFDRLRRGLPIVVHGDGTGLWAPCHRDDVARGFCNAVGNEAAYGEFYNVTASIHRTWNEYHRVVADAIDAPEPEFVHIPTDLLLEAAPERTDGLRRHFQYSTFIDNRKAKRDLDFKQTILWKDGVERTVERLEEDDRMETIEAASYDGPDDDTIIEAWREAGESFLDAL